MQQVALTIPRVAFIAATRGLLGLGAGLLLSDKLPASRRRALGLGLVIAGVATTIPAARMLFGKQPLPTLARGIAEDRPAGDERWRVGQDDKLRGVTRLPRKGDDDVT